MKFFNLTIMSLLLASMAKPVAASQDTEAYNQVVDNIGESWFLNKGVELADITVLDLICKGFPFCQEEDGTKREDNIYDVTVSQNV